METLTQILHGFLSIHLRVAPLFLLSALLIAYGVFWYERPSGNRRFRDFIRWALPKEIYFHSSSFVDVQIFLANRFLAFLGLYGAIALHALAASIAILALGQATGKELTHGAWQWQHMLAATMIIALVSDFGTYWVHRIHHEYPVFWPFHAVHHSAEALTPLTLYRKHPIYDLIGNIVHQTLTGLASGVLLLYITRDISLYSIGSANAVFYFFNLLGGNLRHSHIWLSFGRRLEHIVISPAQHQIHHSIDEKHHNKNYGEVFALWDWMFGTLYLPKKEEKDTLVFGLGYRPDAPVMQQPHPNLWKAYAVPFQESWKALKRRPNSNAAT